MSTLAELAEQVRLAGVVGAGGAGFPTHVKLARRPSVLIINGAECEPLLRVDQELLARRADGLAEALGALQGAMAPDAVWVAIKAKHEGLVAAWRRREQALGIRVHPLGDYYPAGDEHVLVEAVTGRVVPAGGIPPDVGVTVMNVETLYNVGRAVQGRPVTHKFVTVGGAVARPCTVEVPVGTPFPALLAMAGGVTGDPGAVALLEGGPMMGKLVDDPNPVVTRTTKAILALPAHLDVVRRRQADWPVVQRRSSSNCEICQRCTDLCPRFLLGHALEPHRVMRTYAYGGGPDPTAVLTGAMYCVECGVCELYACPVGIYPRRVTGALKARLAAAGVRPAVDRDHPPAVRPQAGERRVPSRRLIARLGLGAWDVPAPLGPAAVPAAPDGTLTVHIPLKPPFGAVCQAVVRPGDRVQAGDAVGETPEKALGARAHASIAGQVQAVTDRHVVIVGPADGGARP